MANLTCPFPTNINPLSPNGFMFSVQKLPDLSYFSQSVALPSISLPEIPQGTPLSIARLPGDELVYDPLVVNFMIDEEMKNYNAIVDWITGLGFPENHNQYVDFLGNQQNLSELMKGYSDGTLSVLDSSFNPIKSYTFIDLFPTSINTLDFSSTTNDVQYLIGQVTFQYSYYKLNQ